jgi:transposase
MQFAEGLSDSQAADAVRSRIDWKYLLGLDLTDSGFDSSVLSEFRNRLCEQGLANKLLDLMLLRFQEKNLIKHRGKQRTDEESPNLILNVETTPATTPDGEVTSTVHQKLADKNLLPDEHFVDAAYVEALPE